MKMDCLRVDKWLWHARLFKSRSLAAKLCATGRIRVTGRIVEKPHHAVKLGDVVTFPQCDRIRVVRVTAFGSRRGPAAEARTLYDDLMPPGALQPISGENHADHGTAERAP